MLEPTSYTYPTDNIIVNPHVDPPAIFFSPDSLGRVFYDTVEEAKEDTGLRNVHVFTEREHRASSEFGDW